MASGQNCVRAELCSYELSIFYLYMYIFFMLFYFKELKKNDVWNDELRWGNERAWERSVEIERMKGSRREVEKRNG